MEIMVTLIGQLVQLGIGGVSLFVLLLMYAELKAANAFNRELLLLGAKERAQMMSDIMTIKREVQP